MGAAFRFLAADAFYYLAVAAHSVGAPFYTFDGQHPTNGFHPLWQYSLTAAFSMFRLPASGQLALCFGASALLAGLGTALFAAAVRVSTGSAALALLSAVPGFFYLLLPPLEPHLFAAWSFANGMESPLSIFFFGLLCHAIVSHRLLEPPLSIPRVAVLSLLLTLLVASRLDDVFLLVPFGLYVLKAGAGPPRSRLPRALAFGAVPALLIGGYLAYNLVSVGSAFPLSGAAKSGGLVLGLLRNGYALLTTLAPAVDLFGRGLGAWTPEAWRILQMLAPPAIAVAWLLGSARRPEHAAAAPTAARTALRLLAVYVLLKAGYNFAFVGLWHQGPWYFPLSIMTVSWMAASALAALIAGARVPAPSGRIPLGRFGLAGALLLVLLHANAFVALKRSSPHGAATQLLWERRDALSQALAERCPGCGLVELDDGIFAYSLSLPVMSGLGLALDREAYAAREHGRFLDLAHERGFTLLASLHYPPPPEATRSDAEITRWLAANKQLRGQRLEHLEFHVVYVDPPTGVAFIRFRPRDPHAPAV